MLRELDKQFKILDIKDLTNYGPAYNIQKMGNLIADANFPIHSSIGYFHVYYTQLRRFIEMSPYDFQYIQGTCKFFPDGKFNPQFKEQFGEYFISKELKILMEVKYGAIKSYSTSVLAWIDNSYQFNEEYREKVDSFFSDLQTFTEKPKNSPTINIVTRSTDGYKLYEKIISENEISIEDNYNDDFKNIYDKILNRLKTNYDKGLVLLHGTPGTGKTTFIRHICGKIKNKKIIYIPSDMAAAMTDPAFLTFLIQYSNSILIIEDAEELLRNRAQMNRTNAISNLLNMSDGLLSDVLNIQILCTFNCPISDIDPALLRKGRIIAKYEFKELCLEKTKKLLPSAIQPMTLADIYNHEDGDFQNNKKSTIGFGLQSVA